MKAYKTYALMRILLTTLFGVAFGVMLLLVKPYAQDIFDILLIAVGLMTAVLNLPSSLNSLFHIRKKGEWINFAVSFVAVAVGVLLALIRRDVILLLLGVFSVVFPILRVALVAEHKKRLKRELPMIFFGLFMVIVSLLQAEETVFLVCSVAVFAVTALYLIGSLVLLRMRLRYLAELEAAKKIEEE